MPCEDRTHDFHAHNLLGWELPGPGEDGKLGRKQPTARCCETICGYCLVAGQKRAGMIQHCTVGRNKSTEPELGVVPSCAGIRRFIKAGQWGTGPGYIPYDKMTFPHPKNPNEPERKKGSRLSEWDKQ